MSITNQTTSSTSVTTTPPPPPSPPAASPPAAHERAMYESAYEFRLCNAYTHILYTYIYILRDTALTFEFK